MQKLKSFLRQNKRYIILFIVLSLTFTVVFSIFSNSVEEMSYSKLVTCVRKGSVESITLDSTGKNAEVKLEDDEKLKKVIVPSVDAITELLTKSEAIYYPSDGDSKIEFKMEEKSFDILGLIVTLLPIVFYVLIFSYIFSKLKSIKGGNDDKKVEVQKNITVRFNDVAGIEPQKEELVEIVDFLKNPYKYKSVGARIPKGILLTGEPGTGKTLLAKAIAGEAGVPFFNMNGSEFEEMFVGLGASRVRKLFKKARENAPSIVFIDEIDAVGGKRDAQYNYSAQTLNQLLVEMDGFEDDNVIIIAATNREDTLDNALLRPGRFDRKIYIPKPDLVGRQEILKIHMMDKIIDSSVNLREIASKTAGYTGAELANVINEAAIIAARNNNFAITQVDINEALRKQLIGIAQKDKVVSDKTKKLVSYHEAGHAIVAELLGDISKVVEISIISRGKAGGYTMLEDSEDSISLLSKNECLIKISGLLAGRAAEKLVLGDVSTGAENDLQRATNIATLMVTKYGMSDEIGLVALTDHEILSLNKDFSNPINQAIKNIIDECNKKAEETLQKNIKLLHTVAIELKDKETLSGEEFRELVKSHN